LGGGPPSFPQGSTCPAVLGNLIQGADCLSPTGLSPSLVRLPRSIRLETRFMTPRPGTRTGPNKPHNPACTTRARFNVQTGFGCSPFAHRYLGNRGFFLFLGVLRCFNSPRSLPSSYIFTGGMTQHDLCRVSPFGHLRVNACLQLTEAFRSLPRPSSPSDAKASTMCP